MIEREKITICDKDDSEMTALFRLAVEQAIAERKAAGLPVVMYDAERNAVYLEYPDGRIEYVEDEDSE